MTSSLEHATMFIPVCGQGREQFRDLFPAARLHRDIDDCIAYIDTVIRAIVECIDDIGTMAGNQSSEIGKYNPCPHPGTLSTTAPWSS